MFKFWRVLMEVVCIVPLISMAMMMGGSMAHPSWDRIGLRMASYYNIISMCGLCGESIITIYEFKDLYFDNWVGCKGWYWHGIK